MYKDTIETSIVGAVDLTGKEGYAVSIAGGLATSGFVYGLVKQGASAGKASVIVTRGRTKAVVNGGTTNINAGDFLKPTTGGVLVKVNTGTDSAFGVHIVALEGATTDGAQIDVYIY